MNDDAPEGKIECLEVLGTPYVLLSDYRRMQIRAADNLAAAEAEAARFRARSADLAAENELLRMRLTAAEADLDDFITEAVEQNCGVPNSHGIRIFSHSFMATYEGWIEFLVQRGKMSRLDEDRELYVFVAELPPSEEAPAPYPPQQ